MGKDKCSKIKLLKLMELLQQETDEQNPMPAYDVCKRLDEQNISCDRRTLSRDFKVLNDYNARAFFKPVKSSVKVPLGEQETEPRFGMGRRDEMIDAIFDDNL